PGSTTVGTPGDHPLRRTLWSAGDPPALRRADILSALQKNFFRPSGARIMLLTYPHGLRRGLFRHGGFRASGAELRYPQSSILNPPSRPCKIAALKCAVTPNPRCIIRKPQRHRAKTKKNSVSLCLRGF